MKKLMERLLFEDGTERYGLAIVYMVFAFFTLFVAAILFGILHSTGLLKLVWENSAEQAEFGGAFTGFLVTLIFLIRSYTQATKTAPRLLIKGNVFLPNGFPAQNAKVSVLGLKGDTPTDSNGLFQIEVLRQESWDIKVIYGDVTMDHSLKLKDLKNVISLTLTKLSSKKVYPPA